MSILLYIIFLVLSQWRNHKSVGVLGVQSSYMIFSSQYLRKSIMVLKF